MKGIRYSENIKKMSLSWLDVADEEELDEASKVNDVEQAKKVYQ